MSKLPTEFNLPVEVMEELLSEVRLDAVRSTLMFGTDPEEAFNRIAAIASLAMSVPVAQITFLGEHTQWFKARLGIDLSEAPTKTSFCAYTLQNGGETVISLDTTLDHRFATNPFVADQPNVRFYLGAPIKIDNQVVGTVCVYDFEPRNDVSQANLSLLEHLANITATLIENHRLKK